jgi:Domain of unknown function (DUF3854)
MPDAVALARAKWESSGLTEESSRILGLTALDGELTAAMGEEFQPVAALHIPYFNTAGRKTNFYRLRYLEGLPGFSGMLAKPQRYAQAKGSLVEAYFPPLVNWREIAEDPERSVIVTEGELKAAAATQRGFPTIGLGGVDSWRATKRGISFLPSLEEVNWVRRLVYVVFDSDAAMNPQVVRAQRQLSEALTGHGAFVSIVALPPNGDVKVGLDDYLLTHSEDQLKELLHSGLPWDESNRLWELNEEILYVRNPGMVVVRDSGDKIGWRDFTAHRYANRHYFEQKLRADGTVTLIRKPLSNRWLEWEGRAELAGITYSPGEPPITEDKWNDWTGWGVEPKAGDVTPWRSGAPTLLSTRGRSFTRRSSCGAHSRARARHLLGTRCGGSMGATGWRSKTAIFTGTSTSGPRSVSLWWATKLRGVTSDGTQIG